MLGLVLRILRAFRPIRLLRLFRSLEFLRITSLVHVELDAFVYSMYGHDHDHDHGDHHDFDHGDVHYEFTVLY